MTLRLGVALTVAVALLAKAPSIHSQTPVDVASLLAQLEAHVLWSAVQSDWRERRPVWLAGVQRARTPVDVANLLAQLEAHVLWSAVQSDWREVRPEWVRSLASFAANDEERENLVAEEAGECGRIPDIPYRILNMNGEEEIGNDSFLGWTIPNHHYDPLSFVVGSPRQFVEEVFCVRGGHVSYKQSMRSALNDSSVYITSLRPRNDPLSAPFRNRRVVETIPSNCARGGNYHGCSYVLQSEQVARGGGGWVVSSYRGTRWPAGNPVQMFVDFVRREIQEKLRQGAQ